MTDIPLKATLFVKQDVRKTKKSRSKANVLGRVLTPVHLTQGKAWQLGPYQVACPIWQQFGESSFEVLQSVSMDSIKCNLVYDGQINNDEVILNIDVSCADWCPQHFRVTANTDGEVEAEMIFSHSLLAAGRMTIGYVVALLMEEGSSKVAERVEAQASNYKEALLSYI